MNKKIFLLTFVVLFFGFVSAATPHLGTFKQNTDIELLQTCTINGSFCDSCNISSVVYPNGSVAISSLEMTKREGEFNYTINDTYTGVVGQYKVNGYCRFGSDVIKNWVYYFDMTLTGNETPEGVPNVLAIIVFVIFGISCFFLFLSSQLNEAGPKIFCLLASLIFLGASVLIGISFIQTYNIAEGVSDSVSYIFFAIGMIIFVMFAYILIRQSVAAFDALQIRKGLKMGNFRMGPGPPPGAPYAGYNIRRPY